MDEIKIKTQAEYYELKKKKYKGLIIIENSIDIIKISGDSTVRLVGNSRCECRDNSICECRDNSRCECMDNSSCVCWENSRCVCRDNSRCVCRDNSRCVCRDNSRCVCRDNSRCECRENSSCVCWENSSCVCRGNSRCECRDNSSCVCWENSICECRENSRCVCRDNSRCECMDNSSCVCWENSSCVCWENSSCVCRDNSSCVCRDNSICECRENSIIRTYSHKQINAKENSIVIFQGCKKHDIKKTKSVKIIETKTIQHKQTTAEWLTLIDRIDEDYVILYKIVNSDLCDYYTGKVKYEIGSEIICQDWDNAERECGGGLHLSRYPQDARRYHSGRLLKCLVHVKDIKVYPYGYQDKCRCKKVKVIEEIK